MVDGEVFILLVVTKTGLKTQMIEADALDSGRNGGAIEVDSVGKPIKYHFIDINNKKFSIKAKYIINYFNPERPTQQRGISEYKQAIIDIKNFSAFQTASIQGARARANIAYSVTTTGSSDPFGANLKDKIQEINGVSVLYMKKGEKVEKLDPDSVQTDYSAFSENTIRLIATARKISYELAFRDYSKVNFASSRASLLQDFKRFDAEQQHFVDVVLNRIYKVWLETEIYSGRIKAPNYEADKSKYLRPKWIMPKRDLVDPLKEITAIEKKINMGITCKIDVANANGEDYEELLKKRAREVELEKQYGLYVEPEVVEVDKNDTGKTDIDEHMTGAESALKKEKK